MARAPMSGTSMSPRPFFAVLDCSYIMYKFYKVMELEWDEAKRENNLAKHGIDFAVASELFTDYFMERLDTRQDYGEDRWVALGMIRGVTVVLVYTEREGNLRPISLRKATAQERSIYEHARQKHVG